ncbi:hypothetical protein [Falsihalocynthiibacter arcticus]|uniref:Uncharacterized protein n=1 Tax=Falsihalocynthiibacter arcticus TaxID=1579316 RepID=A0A126UZ89_9RHOB|nr:hypothetical protein [Falsihalocynthiibacter arcticus]AML51373.1 hypothetical protein RC74_09000 [Falsihalocynthiibacter arcticus]
MRLNVIGACAAVLLLVISDWLHLPEAFGAHPYWSGKVLFIGGVIGILGASVFAVFGSHIRMVIPLFLFDTVLVFGAISAYMGKMKFAESYVENALAGQFWFLGWIAIAAGMSGLIATAARYLWRSSDV